MLLTLFIISITHPTHKKLQTLARDCLLFRPLIMQNLMQSKTQEHAILSNETHRIQLLFSKTTQRDDL